MKNGLSLLTLLSVSQAFLARVTPSLKKLHKMRCFWATKYALVCTNNKIHVDVYKTNLKHYMYWDLEDDTCDLLAHEPCKARSYFPYIHAAFMSGPILLPDHKLIAFLKLILHHMTLLISIYTNARSISFLQNEEYAANQRKKQQLSFLTREFFWTLHAPNSVDMKCFC